MFSRTLLILFTATTLSACGDDGGGSTKADAGYDCTVETRADTYVAGLEKIGATVGFKIRLMDSVPAPPKKGDNLWTIQVVDGSDAPVLGAEVKVTPFMPDHGHGTPIRAEVVEKTGGNYEATPVNLWMPGFWDVKVKVTKDAQVDEVAFGICIDI